MNGFQNMMKNRELAKIFYAMADLLEMQGVEWKPNAYRKAANSIETLGSPIEKVYAKGGIKALEEIGGVGKGIAQKIEEYLKTGKIKKFERLSKVIPEGVEKMMHVPGLGPKKAMRLYKELKIKNVIALEESAKKGKLQKLEGFGKKSEEDVLRGLAMLKQNKGRTLLGFALPLAREFCSYLKRFPAVNQAVFAGSTRRMEETVGDLDILVQSNSPEKVMDYVIKHPELKRVLAKGKTKTSFVMNDGLQIDVRVLDEKSFGSGLQYFTGSKEHNVHLRKIAIRKSFKLSEYGLFKKEKYVCGKTEKEVYAKLGLQFIPPEMRLNAGEIEAAQKNKLPNIIPYNALKGDLHMHTNWSDGINSIEQMAKAAEKLGYKYIAITDHSKSEHIANGMNEKRLLSYLKTLDSVQKKVKIQILKGSEVDILKDGSLDFDDKILKKLDIVVASIHSGFKSGKQVMTTRVLKAFDNPHLNIFAHPTGRLINQRSPYELDLRKVMEKAKQNSIALEINSYPSRLDLNTEHIRLAVDIGCKLSIDTDSHSTEHLKFIELGIAQARRGWVTFSQVINTWPLEKLRKFLKR